MSALSDMRKRGVSLVVLAGILLVALGLRVWGIRFGLPYAYHVDEPAYVSAALNLGAGIIGRQPNPTGFSNLLFAEYAGYFIVGRLTHGFATVADFERSYRTDPSAFLLLGRLTSALMGALSALAIYRLAKASAGRLAGWLAGLYVAVAFLLVRDSHYGVPDVAATFFVSLAILFCVLSMQQPRRVFRSLAAVSAGFAIAVKWSVWPVALPLILIALVSRPNDTASQPRHLVRLAMLDVLFFGTGLLLGGFQLFLKPATYLEYATRELAAGGGGGFGLWRIDVVSGWQFYLQTLAYGLGIVLLLLGVAGCLRRIVLAVGHRDRMSLVLLSFPLAYFLIMGASRHYFARYALPLVPFAALFAAEATVTVLQFAAARHAGLGRVIAAALVVAAVAQPLADDVGHNVLLTRQDTRTLAENWIETNIPANAKIAVDWPTQGPPLSTPDKVEPGSSRVYDVTLVGGTGLSDHPISWYVQQKYDYLIASSFIYDIPLTFQRLDAQRRAFYQSLDQELELVQEFRPAAEDARPRFIFDEIYGPAVSLWQRERPGPTLKIYRVARQGDETTSLGSAASLGAAQQGGQ